MKESVERQTLDLFLAIENKFDTVKKIATVANELTKAKEVKEQSQDFSCQITVWNKVDTLFCNVVCLTCHSNCSINCYIPKTMDSEPLNDCSCMNRETHILVKYVIIRTWNTKTRILCMNKVRKQYLMK